MKSLPAIEQQRLAQHLQRLAVEIGPRLAGSAAERAAADYLVAEAAAIAGVKVSLEEFPVWERAVTHERLEVELDGKWQEFGCSLFNSAPTTAGETLEAPLLFFDAQTGYLQDDLSYLRGQAVVHLGCHIETPAYYRRLIAAEPAFLLFVDIRHPGAVALADGLFPAYVHAYGARTTVNVAYQDAWRWRKGGATRARLNVAGGQRRSLSQNVVLEIAGRDPEGGIIFVGGHHDTQADTPGADDNAAGSASVMELARVLAGRGLRQTVRLISFGAEEQLSIGSAAYVRRHRDELARAGRFMFNIDGSGSALGWLRINYNGAAQLENHLREVLRQRGIVYQLCTEVTPYTDQFPFAAAGVPGVWFTRMNCTNGTWYHHRHDDVVENLDAAQMARQLDGVAEFLVWLSESADFPQPAFEAAMSSEITTLWQGLYGGWQGFGVQTQ